MSYETALEAAGATVLAFSYFGDYQGTWWAKVSYSGEVGWVSGSYGSCSGCDAFEAEFSDWNKEPTQKELSDFGKTYLDGLMDQTQAEVLASENLEWDSEAEVVLNYVKENK